MKSKFHVKSLLLGVVLGTVLTLTIAATTTSPVWEYSVVTEKGAAMPWDPGYSNIRQRKINQFSTNGWEILCEYAFTYEDPFRPNDTDYVRETILRRPK